MQEQLSRNDVTKKGPVPFSESNHPGSINSHGKRVLPPFYGHV